MNCLFAVRVEVDNHPVRLQLCDTAGQVGSLLLLLGADIPITSFAISNFSSKTNLNQSYSLYAY